ncbi:MAG TPA: nitroreductase family protein [Puia sp.]|jgi:nitroreductase
MKFLDALRWRYATKRMTGEKVPWEQVDIILEAARLAPTASGVQPFSIVVIEDLALRERIRPVANNQPQITESSHLLVFAAWDDITPEKVDRVHDQITRERELPEGALASTINRLKTFFGGMTQEQRFQWAARQTYIAFGMAIAAAAIERVDASPMEGFRNAELDTLLGLKERGLRSTSLLALGHRDLVNDRLVHLKKVRRPKEELIIELNELS